MYNVQYMYMYMCTVHCTLYIEDTKTVGIIHIIHACTLKDMHNVHVHFYCFVFYRESQCLFIYTMMAVCSLMSSAGTVHATLIDVQYIYSN